MRGSGAPGAGGAWSVVVDGGRRSLHCACVRCEHRSDRLPTPTAMREAAVAHLGRHALREQLPSHLRSCNCRADGCAWHTGGRPCTGRIVLVLFPGANGRSWHLADVCEACALAIPRAVRVPVREAPAAASPASPPPVRRRRGQEAGTGARQRLAARSALAYTAASLPPVTSGEARLLSVVCALRARPTGLVPLPSGIFRSLRLPEPARVLTELQEARWLHYLGRPCGGPAVFVPELVGAPGPRAGQWALRLLADRRIAGLAVPARTAALAVSAWEEQPGEAFLLDPEGAARSCGLGEEAFEEALADVCATGMLANWRPLPSGLFLCSLSRPGRRTQNRG